MAKKLDISKLAERLNELNEGNNRGESSNLNFLNIKDGRNVIRILPPRDDMELFAEEAWVHYGVGKTSENKKGRMVVCPKTESENNPCPICEASAELKKLSKNKDDSYMKQAKALYRKKRVYYNAISRDEDLDNYEKREEDGKEVWYNKTTGEKESPVKVLATGVGIYKDIMSLIVDPEYGDVTDPDEGLDLIITKTGSGQFNTKYDVKTVRKESAIGFEHWEECLNDLKPLLKPKSYDDLVKIMEGEEPSSGSDDEGEDDNTPVEPTKTDDNASNDASNSVDDDGDIEAEIQAMLRKRREANK